MNKNPAPTMAQLSERITELEVLFTHLQKTIQELNQVILQQGRQADRLAEKLSQLTADYQTSASGPPAERNLLEERPPHY